jgi:hypothetical protein
MRWMRLSTLFLTAVFGILLLFVVSGLGHRSTGVYVWVMEPDPDWEHRSYVDRTLVLHVLEHKCELNFDPLDLETLAEIYRTRTEKILLVYGEPTISHQRMMDVLTKVQNRIPDLHLVLIPPNANVQSWRIRIPQTELGSPRPPWAEGGSIHVR